jgi:hypothetical protein
MLILLSYVLCGGKRKGKKQTTKNFPSLLISLRNEVMGANLIIAASPLKDWDASHLNQPILSD